MRADLSHDVGEVKEGWGVQRNRYLSRLRAKRSWCVQAGRIETRTAQVFVPDGAAATYAGGSLPREQRGADRRTRVTPDPRRA